MELNVPTQAGYSIKEWCRAVGICRASEHNLPPELRPASVKLGKRRIITEAPKDWLARMAERQKVAA